MFPFQQIQIVCGIALVAAFMFLFSWDGAKAQSLGTITQFCGKLENYWRQNPPRGDSVSIPSEADGAMCYGYLLAISGLSSLVATPADGSKPDCSKGFGPNCRHALSVCFPKGVSFEQGLAVVLTYARSHVPQWHETGWHHVLTALAEAFPCQGEYLEIPK
jgi:hypothetical protein